MKDLKKRTITAIVLILILIPVVFFGNIPMYVFSLLMTGFAAYELEKMYKKDEKWNFYGIVDIILSILSFISIVLIVTLHAYAYILILMLSVFLIEGFLMIFTKNSTINTLGNSLITIFYPSIGFSSLALIRCIEFELNGEPLFKEGLFPLLFIVLNCMFTDMFAYFVGCKFGKHKLSKISPKKSWEGSIGGTVFGVLVSTLFGIIVGLDEVFFPNVQKAWAVILLIVLALVLSIIDEIGDLFASKLKRYYGIKDYSQIFPGHGGVLDRFDSYIFVATALLTYLLLFVWKI